MARKLKETSGKHQETHRIIFLVEIQENSAKFKKIQLSIGRIVVRPELVQMRRATGSSVEHPQRLDYDAESDCLLDRPAFDICH